MYLKSIDVVGYKSFAVKTHLDFAPGITGIVGPNGCGKSNIMESVRWCLGEMSYKSLRADAMIEVIFSGTEKRPPLSMTEVTLTFDNSSSQLATQYSEVTVTRRIYRSGESAYFLNRTQCRLRDIREMFLDTGVGGEGYAIIDQGGVDFVLRAKPEERRALFEEAAGVSKYKAKREEALRKLERVEVDMSRLQDSLSLIDEQVKNLDAAARKAKLYKKYEEELVGLEAAKTLSELSVLETQLAELGAKAGPAQERFEGRRAAVSAEEAEASRLELEKAARQAELTAIGNRIAELKGEVGKLDERCRASDDIVAAVDNRRAACDKELAASQTRLADIDPQIAAAGAEVDRVRVALDAAQKESAGWQAEVDACAEAQAQADKALEERRHESLAAAEAALGASREVSLRESDIGHHVSDFGRFIRTLEQDLDKERGCRSEVAALRAEVEAEAARAAAAREKAAAAQAALAELRRRQGELSAEVLRLHSEVSGTKARAEALEAQGGQNPYWMGAQAVLNAGIEGVVGSVRSLIKVEEAWRPYVEDLLGERLFAVVCEHSDAARAGIGLLQASGSGRARFLVLSTLGGGAAERAYPEQAQPLLRHIQYDPRHESAVRFLFAESYALDKALFGDHWVCGGAQPGPGAQLTLADIEELRARLSVLEAQAAERSSQAAQCALDISAAETLVHVAVSEASFSAAREESLRKRFQEKEEALGLIRQNVDYGANMAAGQLRDVAHVKEELIGLRGRRTEAEQKEQACRQAETESAAKAQSARDALVLKRSGQQVLKERVDRFEGEMAIHASRFEQLAENKKHLEQTVAERGRELGDLARRRADAVAAKDQSRQQTQVLLSELGGHENAAAAANARLQETDKSLQERTRGLQDLRTGLEAAQREVQDLELEKGKLQTRQEMLRTGLWDQRQLTVDEAKAKFGAVVVDLEKIDTLRRRINGMGPINLGAPEEYEALAQRQSFLNAQLSDLTQAKDDLKAAIQKINATTRENFRQTFTDAREHFRRLYGVLFEGGEADLVLTNPDDILETGVEIVAQPPGKRLQSISLLSGGEKTMTAIALLFAFFMVRPSPFCMLDEADAALDDANIERFVNMLREFGNRTQFLIISHNKRTMEAADTIYGVTMEEKGVSQIVSIEFQKRAGTHAPARPAEPKAEPVPAPVEPPAEAAAVQQALPMEAPAEPAPEPPPAADSQTPQG
ncbi:MAG: chromosome segregation protein SMC [Elusimicrobia bacterium]|nr:chromosome segregation protein SMC [Elusimicrobiota bacterium]